MILLGIFPPGRWLVRERNLNLRESGRTITDIDFIAYDSRSNELCLFQLKWQQPVGVDNRARRSAGKNLVSEGNKWINAVLGWIDRHGILELARRAGVGIKPGATWRLFVIARYGAYFPGFRDQDNRAVWTDWNHLVKARMEHADASVGDLAKAIEAEVQEMLSKIDNESYALPVGDLTVILNPTREPDTG